MKILAVFISAAVPLLFCSCSTKTKILSGLNAAYVGKNSDEFFIEHGPPASSYSLNKGGKIYRWNSRVKVYQMPLMTSQTGWVNSTTSVLGSTAHTDATYTGTQTTSGGGTVNVYTALNIITDKKDQIEKIKIEKDTIGAWTLSRFAEVFKDYAE